MMSRGDILLEAHKIINGERQNQYGEPEDSFKLIADYWSVHLKKYEGCKIKIKPKDVTIMMTLFKIAREEYQNKRDNLVDGCGYLALAGDMEE